MDVEEARDFIRQNGRAVLATTRSDGGVQMSPVDAVIDQDGYAVLSSRETAIKVKNLRRRPHATLCVFTDAFYGPWGYVEGDVEIVSLPERLRAWSTTTGALPASTPTGTTTASPWSATSASSSASRSNAQAPPSPARPRCDRRAAVRN